MGAAAYVVGVDWDNDGNFGAKAAQFTAANLEYLSIADNASLSTGDINFTIAALVYLDTKATTMAIVAKWNSAANQREYIVFYDPDLDRFRFGVSSDGTAETYVSADALGSPSTATWYAILAWHDAAANLIRIQINNGSINSLSHSVGVFDSTSEFNIGAVLGSSANDGRIDSVGFWKANIAAAFKAQLQRLYPDSTTVGKRGIVYRHLCDELKTDLISWWNLDEASGTRNDSHGTNHLTDNNTVTQATGSAIPEGNSDITRYVNEINWSQGRDYGSQLTAKSIGGSLQATLNNADGRFNSFNAASPLTGKILPGRRIQIDMMSPPPTTGATSDGASWRFFLDTIEPLPDIGGVHKAHLRGIGSLGFIAQRNVSVPMKTNITTGAAIGAVLDEIGWNANERNLATGQTTMTRWWTGGKVNALYAIREIELTEGVSSLVYEDRDGFIRFDDRHFRFKANSVATFSDSPSAAETDVRFSAITQRDPNAEIFNRIEAHARRFTVGASATLWTLSESGANSPSLLSGQSKTLWSSYPNPASSTNAVAVDAWTTPVATTDYTANSAADGSGTNLTANIAVAVEKFDTAMKITLTNNATVTAYITLLQARGTPVTADDPVAVVEEDSTSQTRYGERSFPLDTDFIATQAAATDHSKFILSVYKDPIPIISVIVPAEKNKVNRVWVAELVISNKITLTANSASDLGINKDFFIEAFHHRVSEGGARHTVAFELSPADGYSGFWALGVGALGTTTKLAY